MNLTELLDGNEYGLFYGETLYRGAMPKTVIVDQLLYTSDVICISSRAGVGKSILAKQLMCCLTTGTPFLDTFAIPHPCNVLYIQTEGDRGETLERMELMKKNIKVDDYRWAHLNLPGAAFNDELQIDQLISIIKSMQKLIDVIIIDPLYTTIKGSLNDSEVVTDWIRNVRKLKGVLQCAVIVLNHENKELYFDGAVVERTNGSIFGSTFWAAFFNHNYKLKEFDGHHLLEIGKNRSGKAIDKVAMKMISGDALMYVLHDPQLTDNGVKILSCIKATDKITARKIQEMTGVPRATVFRTLRKLVTDKKIEHVDTVEGDFYKVV